MRVVILVALLAGVAAPAAAQSMDHMNMPGMQHMPGMNMGPKPAAKPKARPKAKAPAEATTKKRAATPRPRAATPRGARPVRPATHGRAARRVPAADPHAGHDMADMPGMDMGRQPATDPHAGHDMSAMPGMSSAAGGDQAAPPMQGHDMSAMPGMDHGQMPGMDHSGMKMEPSGVVQLVTGTGIKPPPPSDHAADRMWGADAMRSSRAALRTDHGGHNISMVLFNLAEYQARSGRDGYRWDGEAWYGGDINRLVVKTQGEGAFHGGVGRAEVQALGSRTIGPYWNLQAGVRYDFKPNPSRTYATIGIEGLAPNNFDVEGAAFLSDGGDVLARLDGYYDQRVTQRLILQPRAEFNLSAQDVPDDGYGAGLVDAELGLRLRYEFKREFAPYAGVSWERQFGDTRRFSRARGEDTGGFGFVAGVRTWF